MSNKDVVDAVLRFLEIAVSWQVVSLAVVLLARRNLPALLSELSGRITKAPMGFEFAKLESQVKTLVQEVKIIREEIEVEPSGHLTTESHRSLASALSSFQAYLQALGYKASGGRVRVRVEPRLKDAYYDGSENRIVLGPTLAPDKDVAFREYAHHALISQAKATEASWDWDSVRASIESGLADYFACSFGDDPLVAQVWARSSQNKPYIRNLDNRRAFDDLPPDAGRKDVGEVWGGAFWELRTLLGPAVADKLLFSTWAALEPSETQGDGAVHFAEKLLTMLATVEMEAHVDRVGSIFERRGLRLRAPMDEASAPLSATISGHGDPRWVGAGRSSCEAGRAAAASRPTPRRSAQTGGSGESTGVGPTPIWRRIAPPAPPPANASSAPASAGASPR
jgi:hypothetical protein